MSRNKREGQFIGYFGGRNLRAHLAKRCVVESESMFPKNRRDRKKRKLFYREERLGVFHSRLH